MNRAVMLRVVSCGILGLGAALLIAALLLSTYTASKIAKIPLDIDTTLVSVGSGRALDPASLKSEHLVVNDYKRLVAQQQITVESPANADVVTLQAGTSVRIDPEKKKDNSLLLAIVDTVTLDRSTALAVSDDTHPGGSVQKPRAIEDDNPPIPKVVTHTGLTYRFPFHTGKESYDYFDPIAQKVSSADYQGEDDVNGLTTYRFTQSIGYTADGKLDKPAKYPSLYDDDVDSQVEALASVWGVEGDPDEKITMTRFYAVQRTFWVDPVSGTIVKERVHANHYYAREALKPEFTLADYTVTSDESTIEAQVNAARDERDRLALWSRVLPITFTGAGLVALVGGVLLGLFGLRTEAALIDPAAVGDHGFLSGWGLGLGRTIIPGEAVSGADAETEQLPAQNPDLPTEVKAPEAAKPPEAAEPDKPDSPESDPPEHS